MISAIKRIWGWWPWFLLPTILYALPVWGARLLWGAPGEWAGTVYLFRLRWGSWLQRVWGARWGGWTSGLAIMLDFDAGPRTRRHELCHVVQFQATGVAGLLIALGCVWFSPWLALGVWALAPFVIYVGAGLASVFGGNSFYHSQYFEAMARLVSGVSCRK